ncbi:MAG: GntR family transcriptional regulator [Fulvivirga sp.]
MKKRTGDTSDRVLQKLLEAIVNGSFVPGDPIRETQIAKEWGVSRTPVREAVRSTAAMGLIELRNNQRPLVKNFGQKDLVKLTDVRIAIELLAFDSSIDILIRSKKVKKLLDISIKLQNFNFEDLPTEKALELDTKLHRLWVDSCDNQFIVLAFESLWTFIRILQRAAANDLNRAATALSYHNAILQAIYEGKTNVARTLLKEHLTSSTPILQELLKK